MLKKIRSPGFKSLRSTFSPWPLAMALEVRGRSNVASLNAYFTRPLQSKPLLGLLPPQRYGVPRTLTARLSTLLLSRVAIGGTRLLLLASCGASFTDFLLLLEGAAAWDFGV